MQLDCIPELCAVLLTQEHNSLPGPGSQVVGFLDAVLEEIVHDFVFGVKSDELL